MLTEAEQNIRFNLEHFIKTGTMQIAISRRDAVHLLDLMRRAEGSAPAPVKVADPGHCVVCRATFTEDWPARVNVKGRGLMHGECADASGIQWRGGSVGKSAHANERR